MFLYTVVPIEEVMKSEADEVKEVELIYLKAPRKKRNMITTTIIIPEASIRIRGALSLERR